MATDKKTLVALKNIVEGLKKLGVKSKDLETVIRHIGQQSRQVAWEQINGRWVYGKTRKYGKRK